MERSKNILIGPKLWLITYQTLEDFTYDFLLQVCERVQGKVKAYKEKMIDYLYCEEHIVESMMDFTYARAVVHAVMIYSL